jgi:hypothetical protein
MDLNVAKQEDHGRVLSPRNIALEPSIFNPEPYFFQHVGVKFPENKRVVQFRILNPDTLHRDFQLQVRGEVLNPKP